MGLSIKKILKQTDHRTWDYPKQPYSFYQEWNRALFFIGRLMPIFCRN